jgi:methyltransferase (TIGR00027 family)
MREGHASRTAEHNALFRALEMLLPESRRLCEDPLAQGFLTWPLQLVPLVARLPGLHAFPRWFIDKRWPGARASVVARTRLIDDTIAASLGEGFAQFVLLGAGFDSRAYRMAGLRDVTVFEVDHPATQASKRARLARLLPAVPDNVRFVPSDFNEEGLASAMAAAGYRESARTFILWEGVTGYLTPAAVDATLHWCARASGGSRLLFTYLHRDVLTRPGAFVGRDRLFASLAKVGEKLTFGMEPSELPRFLADRGLVLESDLGATEYRARYYGDAARKIRGHEFYHVALARVANEDVRASDVV